MTGIRISGFEDRNELRRQLDEVSDDASMRESRDQGTSMRRAAQIELSWLRKEVSELDQRLAIASGKARAASISQYKPLGLISIVAIMAAGLALRRLSR